MDELREIQCPCVAESGIDVERYTADSKDSYAREEYEKARAFLIGLHHEIDNYDRSMTEVPEGVIGPLTRRSSSRRTLHRIVQRIDEVVLAAVEMANADCQEFGENRI